MSTLAVSKTSLKEQVLFKDPTLNALVTAFLLFEKVDLSQIEHALPRLVIDELFRIGI